MDVLLQKTLIMTPENERTHTHIPFSVPAGVGKLRVEYQYDPHIEGESTYSETRFRQALSSIGYNPETWRNYLHVNNLITISLDDPANFRGMAHRGHNHQHIALSRKEATRGFLPGEIVEGVWQVTLSAHAIISPEVTCDLRIEGGDEDE